MIEKIPVTAEGVARARRESMRRKGVGVSVTPELLRDAYEAGDKLRRKREAQSLTVRSRCCSLRRTPVPVRWCAWQMWLGSVLLCQDRHRRG